MKESHTSTTGESAKPGMVAESGTALYIRVATANHVEQQAQAARQERLGRAASKRLKSRIVDVFSDLGSSGLSATRPGLEDLPTLAQAGQVKYVIAENPARFARSLPLYQHIHRQLSELGVTVIDNLDTRGNERVQRESTEVAFRVSLN